MQGNSTNLFGDTPTKRCKGCREVLPLTSYYLVASTNGKRYAHSYCKPCLAKQGAKWAKTAEGRRTIRAHNLKRKFGVTVPEYDAMVVAQGNLCALCGSPERHLYHGSPRRLSIDHCHKTGKVRALLCAACNKAIGLLRDDPQLLRKAADYIERHAT